MFLSLLCTLNRLGSSTNKDARATDKDAYTVVDKEQGSAQLKMNSQKSPGDNFLKNKGFSPLSP
jgi:hypothetical protein